MLKKTKADETTLKREKTNERKRVRRGVKKSIKQVKQCEYMEGRTKTKKTMGGIQNEENVR